MRKTFRFITWKDIDRYINLNRNEWEDVFISVEIYPSEAAFYLKKGQTREIALECLKKLFGEKLKDDKINLEIEDKDLPVTIEMEEVPVSGSKTVRPLFQDILYSSGPGEIQSKKLPGKEVIAFHSYKGGVGRTLSVLAFAKAWSEVFPNEKILIVDADIEAPGLTWLLGQNKDCISYLDLLELVFSPESNEKVVKEIVGKLRNSELEISANGRIVRHYYMPAYRYIEQLLDMYVTPSSVVKGVGKTLAITNVLSLLGKELGVEKVLVDLRAGISEYSAPLLFDTRVKKYIVTSTSKQSVYGTKILLEQITKGIVVKAGVNIPTILLNMTTNEAPIMDIEQELLSDYGDKLEEESLLDNVITEVPFASELVHLGDFSDVMEKLNGRDFYAVLLKLVRDSYKDAPRVSKRKQGNRDEVIRKLHDTARKQIVAESNQAFGVLMTRPIQNLVRRFNGKVPKAVVMGAKGSGKTFLYRELLKNKTWEGFVNSVTGGEGKDRNIFVVPVVSPANSSEMQSLLINAETEYSKTVGVDVPKNFCSENASKLERYTNDKPSRSEWKDIWLRLICPKEFESLDELDGALKKRNSGILFIFDGLEEIFRDAYRDECQQNAVAALCQDFINALAMEYDRLGCLIFVRKDVVQNSIPVNFAQFEGVWKDYQLSWSHIEAMRLALWLTERAVPGFYKKTDIKIEEATGDVIEAQLYPLWGKKLGRDNSNEAYSSRWILAALSDFNGQLQARDIIRFLEYATENVGNEVYADRYIMPAEIRNAVPKCSNDKLKDIKQEMKSLEPILVKFENSSSEDKILPFERGAFGLTTEEEKLLGNEGYLRLLQDKCYLPEILRHGLQFRYNKGARPKVLSLLLKK